MGNMDVARLAATVWLVSLGGVTSSQAASPPEGVPVIYVDAPIGTTTEVLALNAVPVTEGGYLASTGTCPLTHTGRALAVAPEEETGCTIEVHAADGSVLYRAHVQGVPPVDTGRGITVPYQAAFRDWRYGHDGQVTAHTLVSAAATPVVLEGVGDTAALLGLGVEVRLMAAAESAEAFTRWWEVSEPFRAVTLAPGDSLTLLLVTPPSVLGVRPLVVFTDPGLKRWSQPLMSVMAEPPARH